jgi:Predicted dehydrogenases and related proteins
MIQRKSPVNDGVFFYVVIFEAMLEFAIIGCGTISKRHAENIVRIGKLSAVCDIIPEKADQLANKYKAKAYYSIDYLLKNEPSIEIIVVCTPNGLHAEHSIKSLQAEKNVLCEKPLCLTSVAASQVIDTAYFFRKKIFVVKQNRFNPPVQFIKKALKENKLGKVYSFQMNCFWNRPQEYYKGDWKGTNVLDGGILYTQFSHFIDLLYWFLGDVDQVKGFKAKYERRKNMEIEDTGVAILLMKNGASGTLNYTVNAFNRNLEGSFTLFCEKGTVKIGGQYLNTLEWYETSENKPILEESTGSNDYGFYQGSMSNHHKVYEELVANLNGDGSLPQAKDAIKTIEIIEKIYAATSGV